MDLRSIKSIFKMRKPCSNCPFRRQGAIELREGRLLDIKASLLADDHEVFHCHKTLNAPEGKAMCMGAAAWTNAQGRPNMLTRLALILGILSQEELDSAEKNINRE